MEVPIFMGEWTNSLRTRMANAKDGDCFCLPTYMHLHAFNLLKEELYPGRDFKVELKILASDE
jgi:hypothetical protein